MVRSHCPTHAHPYVEIAHNTACRQEVVNTDVLRQEHGIFHVLQLPPLSGARGKMRTLTIAWCLAALSTTASADGVEDMHSLACPAGQFTVYNGMRYLDTSTQQPFSACNPAWLQFPPFFINGTDAVPVPAAARLNLYLPLVFPPTDVAHVATIGVHECISRDQCPIIAIQTTVAVPADSDPYITVAHVLQNNFAVLDWQPPPTSQYLAIILGSPFGDARACLGNSTSASLLVGEASHPETTWVGLLCVDVASLEEPPIPTDSDRTDRPGAGPKVLASLQPSSSGGGRETAQASAALDKRLAVLAVAPFALVLWALASNIWL